MEDLLIHCANPRVNFNQIVGYKRPNEVCFNDQNLALLNMVNDTSGLFIPCIFDLLVNGITMDEPQIFRLNGDLAAQNDFICRMNDALTWPQLDDLQTKISTWGSHDICVILKKWVKAVQGSVIEKQFIQILLTIQDLPENVSRKEELELRVFLTMPKLKQALFRRLMIFLNAVGVAQEGIPKGLNHMGLASMIAPNLTDISLDLTSGKLSSLIRIFHSAIINCNQLCVIYPDLVYRLRTASRFDNLEIREVETTEAKATRRVSVSSIAEDAGDLIVSGIKAATPKSIRRLFTPSKRPSAEVSCPNIKEAVGTVHDDVKTEKSIFDKLKQFGTSKNKPSKTKATRGLSYDCEVRAAPVCTSAKSEDNIAAKSKKPTRQVLSVDVEVHRGVLSSSLSSELSILFHNKSQIDDSVFTNEEECTTTGWTMDEQFVAHLVSRFPFSTGSVVNDAIQAAACSVDDNFNITPTAIRFIDGLLEGIQYEVQERLDPSIPACVQQNYVRALEILIDVLKGEPPHANQSQLLCNFSGNVKREICEVGPAAQALLFCFDNSLQNSYSGFAEGDYGQFHDRIAREILFAVNFILAVLGGDIIKEASPPPVGGLSPPPDLQLLTDNDDCDIKNLTL